MQKGAADLFVREVNGKLNIVGREKKSPKISLASIKRAGEYMRQKLRKIERKHQRAVSRF